jgi:DNA polymerase-3 subunit delta'
MDNWNIIGHTRAIKKLQLALERDSLPHALLITGPDNIGKETLALTLAKAMLCTAPPVGDRPCGTCSACRRVNSLNHPDLLLITPEEQGRGVKIDQIRELQRTLSLTPNESRYKVGILTHFERATHNAANALLKTLEEPPPYAHLILLATSSDLLLPTIVSRTQQLPLHPLNRATVEKGLVETQHIPQAQAQRMARLSGGRVGWAIQALEEPEHAQEMEESVEQLFQLLRSDLPTRFDVAKQLSDDPEVSRLLAYWRTTWRDVMLLQTQNDDAITHSEHRESLARIARQVNVEKTAEVLRYIEETQTALRQNGNTRLHVEALLLKLPAVTWE